MIINNERGSALILTIIIMLVLMVIGGALAMFGMVEIRQAQLEEDALQAYYLARSGADAMAQYIIENPKEVDELLAQKDLGFGDLAGDKFFVIVKQDTASTMKIQSTGVYNGVERSVQLSLVQESRGPELDKVIYATNEGDSKNPALKIEGGAKITGDVITNTTGKDSVVFSGTGKIEGNLLVGAGADPAEVVRVLDNGPGVSGTVENLEEERNYFPPAFPEFPDDLEERDDFSTPWEKGLNYLISENGSYDKIEVTSSRTLKFDLSETRIIKVRSFKVDGTIELVNVAPGSELLIYVEETFKIGGDREMNYGDSHDPKNLTLYYAGKDTFGDAQFRFGGNIVVKDAQIKIAQGCHIRGGIFSHSSQDVIIGGGSNTTDGIIYAPHAHLAILDGAKVEGAVIASSLHLDGGTRLRFNGDYVNTENFPAGYFPLPPENGKKVVKGVWSAL